MILILKKKRKTHVAIPGTEPKIEHSGSDLCNYTLVITITLNFRGLTPYQNSKPPILSHTEQADGQVSRKLSNIMQKTSMAPLAKENTAI